MIPDPTEEIRSHRHRLGAEINFDIDRLIADIQPRPDPLGQQPVAAFQAHQLLQAGCPPGPEAPPPSVSTPIAPATRASRHPMRAGGGSGELG